MVEFEEKAPLSAAKSKERIKKDQSFDDAHRPIIPTYTLRVYVPGLSSKGKIPSHPTIEQLEGDLEEF